jgi:hypothetical protein
VQQLRDHGGLLGRRLARVRQGAAQPVLGIEQPDDREQLVADLLRRRRADRDRAEALPQIGVGRPARTAQY